MSDFVLDQHTATQKRLSNITDGGFKKSTYVSTGNTFLGYLTPVSSSNQSVGIDRFGQSRSFETNAPADIQESDVLTIDGVDYQVKSYAAIKGIVIHRVRVILTLPKNG